MLKRFGALATFRKCGRFLEPMTEIVKGRLAARLDERKIAAALRDLSAERKPPAACAGPGAQAVANLIP